MFTLLTRQYGLDTPQFAQLYDGAPRIVRYLSFLELGRPSKATEKEKGDMRRMAECLRALQAGKSWTEATAVALVAHPKLG